MKRFFISLLCAVMVILCVPMLSASAAEEPLVGINGEEINMSQGYASGKGWEMVFNRRDQIYTLTLTEGRFDKITSYGDLCLNIPAGANITVGKDSLTYAVGVQNGTLCLNGTGSLTLVGINGLIANSGNIEINGVNLSVSATKYGIYTKNGSLTVNGGTVNTRGSMNGIFTTEGLYVNGGKINATADTTASSDPLIESPAGINLQTCYAVIAGGEVTAEGYYAVTALQSELTVSGGTLQAKGNTYGLYTGPNPSEEENGKENLNKGQSTLRMTDGKATFTGSKGGVYLCNNSRCEITGGELNANVTGSGDVSYTAGLQLEKSDFRMTGGRLNASGFYALNVNGLSSAASDGKNSAVEMLGGSLCADGSYAGLYLQYTSVSVSGGTLKATASKTQGVYIFNTDFTVGGGMLTALGGSYGICAHSKSPRFEGGTVYADGNSYGIYCNAAGVLLTGGNITAVGGKAGVSVPGDTLTVGTSSASRVSLTAMGGDLAMTGKTVMLFGRTYNDPATQINHKVISFVDGAEAHTSDTFCTLKINGSPMDLVSEMAASEQNVVYNDGGTAASYKWMLKKDSGSGRYSLTLNGATLTGMEISGALDIILNSASSLRGNMNLNNAYVRLDTGSAMLSLVPSQGNAMDLLSSVFMLRSGTMDVRSPIGAYASDLLLFDTVQASHRSETFNVSAGKVYLMNADISNADATAMFALNSTDLQAYGSNLQATGVSGYVFDAGDSNLLFDRCTLTANGGNGLYARQIIANSSTFSVTGCVGRAFSVGNGGLHLYNCKVTAGAQEEAVFSLGDMLFDSTDLRADSAEGVKAVLLSAPAGSEAAITVTGHCLIKSGKDPVRIADENGVASYFANENTALSGVYISNDHNYTQSKTYMYCNQIGTGVMTCTYTNCKTAMTKTLPETAHDFSAYIPNNDATCYEDGTKTATCPVCFEKKTVADVGSKTDHVFSEYKSNGDADCLTDGTKTAKCDFCDVTDTKPDVNSALGHDRKITEVKGDCQNNVWTSLVCSRCGDATEPVDTGRLGTCKWDETRSCYDIRYCTVCGETDGMILMHAYGQFISDNNASCTVNGTLSATCRRCGEKQTRPDPDAVATGHTDNEWVIVKEPTAFETGIKAMTCKNCPLYYNEKTMPLIVVPHSATNINVDIEKSIIFVTAEKMTAEQFMNAIDNKENCILTGANGSAAEKTDLIHTNEKVKITANGQEFTFAVLADTDCDGQLSPADARIALRAAVGLEKLTDAQVLAADLAASDGEITPADARIILRKSVGLN